MDKKIYIYFAEHDIYFGEQMFTLVNINLELKSALRTKYLFCRTLLYMKIFIDGHNRLYMYDGEISQSPVSG